MRRTSEKNLTSYLRRVTRAPRASRIEYDETEIVERKTAQRL